MLDHVIPEEMTTALETLVKSSWFEERFLERGGVNYIVDVVNAEANGVVPDSSNTWKPKTGFMTVCVETPDTFNVAEFMFMGQPTPSFWEQLTNTHEDLVDNCEDYVLATTFAIVGDDLEQRFKGTYFVIPKKKGGDGMLHPKLLCEQGEGLQRHEMSDAMSSMHFLIGANSFEWPTANVLVPH